MAVKVVLMFTLDKYSWTEDHYWLGAGGTGALALAIPAAQQLAASRVQLLGYDAQIERVRLSNFPANQQVDDLEFNQALVPTWEQPAGTPAFTASRAFTALLTRIQSADGFHRNYYLAGAPAGLFHSRAGDDTGMDFSQVPSFLLRYLAFTTYLTSGPWGWLTRTQSVLVQAAGLVTNASFPGMLGITVGAQLAGVGVGSSIQVKGWRRTSIKATPQLTGVYRVGGVLPPVAPSTLWTYFIVNSTLISPSNFFTLGQVGPYTPSFKAYANTAPVEATSRKRGATTLRPRGRSRVQF